VSGVCNVHGQSAEFTQGNKSSSAVSLDVSLGSYPGRGVSLPVNLHYSSQGLWRIGFINSVYANTYVGILRQSVTEAIYAEHSTAGWTTSLDVPKVEWPRLNDRFYASGKPYANGYVGGYTFRIARVFIHMPDGSTHELRKADAVYQDNNYVDMSGTFYAVDGSRMRYDSTGETTGTLFLSDGTRYVLNGSSTQYIDRNGNTLNFNATNRQWTDTLGRPLNMPWPINPGAGDYTYSIPGLNGSITYTLKFKNLSEVFLADVAGQTQKPIADRYLPNPYGAPTDWNGGNFPQGPGSNYLFASAYTDPEETEQSYVHVVGKGQSGSTPFNPVVLAEIDLPNGQNYKFFYNAYGELDKVIYPTGGYQRYQYGLVSTIGFTGVPYHQASRGMLSRWISPSGSGSDEAQWTYSASAFPRVVTAPDATGAANGTRSEIYLYLPASYYDNDFGYEESLLGMPIEERIYASASQGGAMLRRTLFEYSQTSATINKPVPQYFPGTYTAYRNARPTKTVNLILDTGGNALVTRSDALYDTTYQFTVGVDATSSSEYAYTTVDQTTAQTCPISSMPTGALVRTTQTAYLTGDANYRNRNILGLPTSSTIYNGTGGIVAQSSVSYDETSFGETSSPLLTYESVTGWTDPQTPYRGNPTTTSRWLDYPMSTWIATHAQYDQCGSVRKTWDARDTSFLNPTQIEYAAINHYAYPTKTYSSVPDSSGTYGSPASLEATSVYDFNTGLVTSTIDANNRTTNFEYNDALNRPTKVTRPDGGWTTTAYGDAPGNIYVRTQTLQHSTPTQQATDGYAYFDNLGRSVRSFVYDGMASTPWVVADSYYDSLGRVSKVSNPYRVSSPSAIVPPTCSVCTTAEYDSLGRAFRVTTPDGAQRNTTYSASITGSYLGPTVTATDQAGKARKSITDAQGRLIQVIEDPAGVAWQTNYTYDALNNLRMIDQGGQLRYFGYDSLSRVIRVRHVEQTINASLPAWTDPVTGYSGGWTAAFTYDNNGNQLTRTDARNISSTLTYDQLNRVTTVRYANDPQNTPGVDTYYDGYRAGAYTSIQNVKGHVWQNETIGQVRFTLDEFDVMGRPKIQRQQFWTGSTWSSSYQVSASYDLAGALTAQTYPSDHSISYVVDQAGRLTNFSGNLGNGISRTYASNFQYNDFGALQQEQFGTQTTLYHKQRFNVRGQLWDMRLSTVSFTSDPANGDRGSIINYYSGSYSQGGSGTDNNGNLLRQESYIPNGPYFQQTYNYDNLSRLTSVSEKLNGTGTDSFKQVYTYDRWGNRAVDWTQSSCNVPRPSYTVDQNTNRLIAPTGYSFGYDSAGNQTNDSYTGGGQRVFDAENHMTSAQEASGWQYYKYSGSGLRVRRIVNGVEVWQVYGIGGSLLAEYAANTATNNPTKEYGYRNGELLIAATITSGWGAPPVLEDNPLKDPQNPESFKIKAIHITQLRDTINALRAHCNLPNYQWLKPTASAGAINNTVLISWEPIDEMRMALDEALGAPPNGYASGLAQGQLMLAVHIQELRDRVLAAWQSGAGADIRWLVTDQLGTPRLVVDVTGNPAGVTRHDYLPFGEEIGGAQVGLIGGRVSTQGYSADGMRQKFTGYEADGETGLNYARARYQSSVQGRFTGVDPLGASADVANPQSFNRYSYVENTPLIAVDPTGMALADMGVYQTANPEVARKVERAEDQGIKNWVTKQGQTIGQRTSRAWLSRAMNAAIDKATVTASGEVTGPIANPQKTVLSFSDLWRNHPGVQNSDRVVTLCAQYAGENCAIRLSVALQRSGMDMSSFEGATCNPTTGGSAAIRTAELANWLADPKRLGPPEKFKSNMEIMDSLISGSLKGTGILYLKGFLGNDPGRWNHIDLWNGYRMGAGNNRWLSGEPREVWFWPIK
jgi:RHS repeat-associated protein